MKGTNCELTDNQLGVVTGGYTFVLGPEKGQRTFDTWMPKKQKPIRLDKGPICQL